MGKLSDDKRKDSKPADSPGPPASVNAVPDAPVPPAPALSEVKSPPPEEILKGVPAPEEVIEDAQSVDEILEQQPDVEELVRPRRKRESDKRTE